MKISYCAKGWLCGQEQLDSNHGGLRQIHAAKFGSSALGSIQTISRASNRWLLNLGLKVLFAFLMITGMSPTFCVTNDAATEATIVPLADISKVSAGYFHTCAITTTGGVKCWGSNDSGQLGDGSTTFRAMAVDVTGLSRGVIDIAGGLRHTCAVTSVGGVKCWGQNTYSQLGEGSTTTHLTPVDVSNFNSRVTAIATGYNHSCLLTATGGVKCWGSNGMGSLGENSTNLHSTPVDVTGLASGVVAITAGGNHTCALTSAGGVKCWGFNSSGQIGDSTVTTRLTPVDVTGLASGVVAISAGGDHTCALTSAGGVKCWGNNIGGQLGDDSTTNRLVPVNVTGLVSGLSALAAGANAHACALTTAGGVKCWGQNFDGRLGDNSMEQRLTPVDVVGLASGVAAITGGGEGHTCALTTVGGVKCWGERSGLTPVDVLTNPGAVTSVPGSPTGLAATVSTFGYGQATVTFDAPASDGGTPISRYTVTSSPEGATAAGPASPIFISGLTNGSVYSFTVTASNDAGTSAPSSPSAPLTISTPLNVAPVANPGFASLRILLVPFHFPGAQPPFSTIQVQEKLMGDDAYSARSLWLRNSYGAFALNVDVKPWTALRNSKTYHQAQDPLGGRLRDEALAILAENYSLVGYDAVAVMLTPLDYGYPGMAAVQRPGLPIGSSGTTLPVLIFSGNYLGQGDTAVMAHEIGHVLGFMHTSTIDCAGGWTRSLPPALSDPYFDEGGCGSHGEASFFAYAFGDPMGYYVGQTHPFNMLTAGWLGTNQIQSLNQGGDAVLDALEINSGGLKAIRIDMGSTPDGKPVFYTVDYRGYQVLNPDTRSLNTIEDSVRIWVDLPRLWDPLNNTLAPTDHLNFEASNTAKPREMSLATGSIFLDPYRGIRIQRVANQIQNGIKQTQVNVDRSKLVVVPELFSRLAPGQTQQFTLRNDGGTNVIVTGATLKGRHAAQFEMLTNSCTSVTLLSAASCEVNVRFNGGPAVTDSDAAQVYLQWDNSDNLRPHATVGLQGVPLLTAPANPTRLLNIATRGRVETVDNVMIAGFIIQGSSPKKVLIRARGPSLAAAPFNVPGTLSDPFLTLYSGATPIDSNDDFALHANAAQIPADWIPANAKEAAIVTTLNPGAYTAIVNGVGATSGVAIVEVFEIDQPGTPLINIATRGPVYTGDNVMIAGLIIQGDAPKTVLITARGPSMAGPPHNVPGTLANPTLTLYSGQTVIGTNDNWTEAANATQIQTAIGAPSNTLESAILVTLQPGAYTAIVSGAGGGTGLAIVEVFAQ